jgi:hypothetical protein
MGVKSVPRKRKPGTCTKCGEWLPILAKGMCVRCYHRLYEQERMKRVRAIRAIQKKEYEEALKKVVNADPLNAFERYVWKHQYRDSICKICNDTGHSFLEVEAAYERGLLMRKRVDIAYLPRIRKDEDGEDEEWSLKNR